MKAILPSLSLRSASGALLFHWDGFLLRGAIYRKSDGRAEASVIGESFEGDLTEAVGQVLSQIRSRGYSPPSRAAVVTANAVSALLDLPVSPDKPRPRAQMQELVRWELEPLLVQQNDSWSVGALLEGRGFLTPEQRREVAVEAELAAAEGGRRRIARFGELAVEKGFVTSAQVEECLRMRDTLVVEDDELRSGWQAQAPEGSAGEQQVPWLACGIGSEIRRRLQTALRENRITLDWIYPELGTSFPLLPNNQVRVSSQLLIECHREQICCVSGAGGLISTLRYAPLREREITAETLAEVAREEITRSPDQIWLMCEGPGARALAAELANLTGRPVQEIADAEGGLAGAASHLMGLAPTSSAVRLDGKDPAPPIWRNADLVRIAAAVAAVAAVGTTDVLMTSQLESKQNRLVELETAYSEQLELNKKLRIVANEAGRLAAHRDKRKLQVEAAREELALIEDVLIRRRKDVPRLLEAVVNSINDEVVIDSINESADAVGNFTIAGWALTDTSAQLFTNRLDRTLESLELTVTDQRLRRAVGRFGLDGYSIDLRLISKPPDEAVAGRRSGAQTQGGSGG